MAKNKAKGQMVELISASLSDVGRRREINEDFFSVDDSIGLYLVADGMGGHLAGEVASKVAVQIINKNVKNWIANNSHEDELFDMPDNTLSKSGNYLSSGIKLANKVIYEMANEYDEYKGMGTTIVALSIMPNSVITANVGDSRIYLLRGGGIELLSREHKMVSEQLEMGLISEEEAKNSPLKHVLTRNLGSSESVDVDVFEIEPMDNDRYLLCTDGLTDLVSDDDILNIIGNGDDPNQLCRDLVVEANKRGGHDNVTVALVCIKVARPKKKFWQFFKK